GPFLPERVTLRPGQRLTARLASGELRIDGARTDAPAARADAPVAAARADAPVVAARADAPVVAARADAPVVAARAEAPVTAAPVGATRLSMPHRVRARQLALEDARAFVPGAWPAEVAAGAGAAVVAAAEAHGVDK